MRSLCLLALLGALSACDLLGPRRVTAAAVQSVSVVEVDLSRPWDNPLTGDKPDIYVDLRNSDGSFDLVPDYRSDVRENVTALPLVFPAGGSRAMPFGASAWLSVNDRDVVGDDVMFSTGPFSFESYYHGEPRGDVSVLEFENEQGRVSLVVRWE